VTPPPSGSKQSGKREELKDKLQLGKREELKDKLQLASTSEK
jgi:hypothetical protein